MIKRTLAVIAACLLANAAVVTAQDAKGQHEILQQTKTAGLRINDHPQAQWFPDAGLGLFVHFGLAAIDGGIDLSWGMRANKSWDDGELPPTKYWALADGWNPRKFNPDKFIRQAKEAGFKYAVFTTKHHDGYTMWPSKYSDFGVGQKMGGRDLVKEFTDACHKYGLKCGLYFSPPDWYFDREYISFGKKGNLYYDYNHNFVEKLPSKPKGWNEKRKAMIKNQLEELLTDYGRIDLLFFDGGQAEVSNDWVRELQPGIVINRRNKQPGDYNDSEGALPTKRFYGWFETNDTCWPSNKWSYSTCSPMDTGEDVIEKLVKVRAWGGNYLANVGPAPDGSIPKEALEAWKEIGKWMKHSGESIYGTTAGTWPESCNTPMTVKEDDGVFYLHAFPNKQGAIKVWNLEKKPQKAILLRTGEEIPFEYSDATLSLKIFPQERTRQVDVVKVIF